MAPLIKSSLPVSSERAMELLYVKSQVFLHPSSDAKDNIPGFLFLGRNPQDTESKDLILGWTPEHLLEPEEAEIYRIADEDYNGSSGRQYYVSRPLLSSISEYSFGLHLRDIFSIEVRLPSPGWWYGSIVINARDGFNSTPVLFFHDDTCPSTIAEQKARNQQFDPFASSKDGSHLFWGGDQFLAAMEKFADIERSTLEPSCYLVNPSEEDRRSFSPRAGKFTKKSSKKPDLLDTLNDVKFQVLEKLAKLSLFSKKTAKEAVDNSPAVIKSLFRIPEVEKVGNDFESAQVYLAKWALKVAEDAERSRMRSMRLDNRYKSLFGESERGYEADAIVDEEVIQRRGPVSKVEWDAFFDHTGRLCITSDEVLERIFHGGLKDQSVRREAWLFLLGVYPWSSSAADRENIAKGWKDTYMSYLEQWEEDYELRTKDEYFRDQNFRIFKDIMRTDRTLPEFKELDVPNKDENTKDVSELTNKNLEAMKRILLTFNVYDVNLGYVQGMTDLLSPLYVTLEHSEHLSFAAFVKFMERMERNFLRSQTGMKDQLLCLSHLTNFMLPDLYEHLLETDSANLFFFFRMILVWFKREFEWDDTCRLWEVLWTNHYSSQFHLFVALAILHKHKRIIMENLKRFDEVLKYMNDLSGHIDLEDTLIRAEYLFLKFKNRVALIDRSNEEIEKQQKNSSEDTNNSSLIVLEEDLRSLLDKKNVILKEEPRQEGAVTV